MHLYADNHRGWFPISNKENAKAHDSFQLLVDAMHEARYPKFSPDLFICPVSKDIPAKCDSKGFFKS